MSTVANVVALVKEVWPRWAVEDFPDRPADYKLLHPKGAILVQYGGSRFGTPETLDVMVQQRVLQFGLRLIGNGQHGVDGVVTVLNSLIGALPGRRVANCDPIRLVRDYFECEHGGRWEYQVEIEMTTLNVGCEIEIEI
jgi:hypothetical protein